jgi:hypothetical protein
MQYAKKGIHFHGKGIHSKVMKNIKNLLYFLVLSIDLLYKCLRNIKKRKPPNFKNEV